MSPVLDHLDLYAQGFLRSLWICLIAMVGSLVLGTVLAGFRVSPVPTLRWFGSAYVTVVRNTPLTVVLFMFGFGLPTLGLNASFYVFGVTALITYTSAFVCEAVRSGVNSVAPGQAEAARSLGLNFTQSLTTVVLPQAFRTVVPPLGSVIIAMFKNSAVVGAFGVGGDLYSVAQGLSSAQGEPALPVYIGSAIGYLIITLSAGALLAVLERKVAIVR